jgi:integrase
MPKLTAAVEKHRAHKTRREIPDAACPGLYLIVQPSGAKSFALRFRNQYGRHVKLTLGRLDVSGVESTTVPTVGMPLTLISARKLAMDVHRQRVLGNDVVADRRREKLERKAGQSNLFSQAALDFTEIYLKRNVRRWQAVARLLGVVVGDDGALTLAPKGLADRWRDRPVGEISADHVHAVTDEVREKRVPGLERRAGGPSEAMARVMHTTLSRLFRWLLEKRRIAANPMHGSVVPKAGKSRDRVLTDAEIVKFWKACDTVGSPVAQCLKLLLLTGCRRDEIGKLSRAEMSDDGSTITIPASRSKNKKVFVIPLPPLARDILRSVKTSGEFVFDTGRGKPIAAWSRIKTELDAVLKFSTPWVLHDLRRVFSTGLNKIGVAPEVVEACLNHISGSKAGVAGVYNQYAYLPEKTVALQRWADHVAGLVEGRAATVVPIKKRKDTRAAA